MKTFIARLGIWAALATMLAVMPACNLSFGSKTIRVIGSTSMSFTGAPTCQFTADEDDISISWPPAHGANGTVTYAIYSDSSLTQLISLVGKNTNFDYDISSVEADKFSIYITATDNDGTSAAMSCYLSPQGGKHLPSAPVSGIWVTPAAQDKILVQWDAATVASDINTIAVYYRDDAIYNDQHKNSTKRAPLCSTHWDKHSCLVTGLPFPNYQYRFLVRATNTSNFEDHNTDEGTYLDMHGAASPGGTYTLDHEVVNFGGILDLRKTGGVPGLTSLDIYVIPASSGTLGSPVSGYFVSVQKDDDDAIGTFDFLPQIENGWSTSGNFTGSGGAYLMYQPATVSGVPVTKFRIDGLSLATKYCVNVRAFVEGVYTDADHNSKDMNRVTLCQTTNSLAAPSSFGGLTSLLPKAVTGTQTVDYLNAKWNAPSTDGVYSEFVLFVKDVGDAAHAAPTELDADQQNPTCHSQDWTGIGPGLSAPAVTVDQSTFTAQISGVTPGHKYYAKIFSHYQYTDGNGATQDVYSADAGAKCAWAIPPTPIFAGLLSVKPAPDAGGVATGNTTLTYQFVSAADATRSFSDYVLDISPSPTFVTTDATQIKNRLANGQTLFNTCLRTDAQNTGNGVCPSNIINLGSVQSQTSGSLNGFTPDQKYYVLAYARYTGAGTPYLVAGPATASAVKELQMTPPRALGEAITGILILDPNTVKLTWQAPTSGQYPDVGGVATTGPALYNQYIVFHQCGNVSGVSPQTVVTTTYNEWLNNASSLTYPSAMSSAISTSTPQFVDSGITSNSTCCYMMRAQYKDPSYTLRSATLGGNQITGPFPANTPPQTGVVCAMPQLLPPDWTGISTAAPVNSSAGFYSAAITFPAINANDVNNFSFFQADYVKYADCQAQSVPIEQCFSWDKPSSFGTYDTVSSHTSLTVTDNSSPAKFVPNEAYYFAVRAVHLDGQTNFNSSAATFSVPSGSAVEGTNYVWNPHAGTWNTIVPRSFASKLVYMHPKVPVSSNDSGSPGGFSVMTNGETALTINFNMPSGPVSDTGVYNTMITIIAGSAGEVSNAINFLKSNAGGGGKAAQIDLYKSLSSTTYNRILVPSSHTLTLPDDGSGHLFGEAAYPYTALILYEPISEFGSVATAVTNVSNFSSGGFNANVVQMLAQIDPGAAHNPAFSLLPDTIPNAKAVTLQLNPPQMNGNITLVQSNDLNDFTKIHIYGAPVLNIASGTQHTYCEFQIRQTDLASCDPGSYSATQSAGVFDLAGVTRAIDDCANLNINGIDVTGLTPNKTYCIHERALTMTPSQFSSYISTPPGNAMISSPEAQTAGDTPFITQPARSVGDGVVLSPAPSVTTDPSGYYQTTITYSPPVNATGAGATAANHVWVFKAVAANVAGNTQTAVKARLAAAVLNLKQSASNPSQMNPNLVAILPWQPGDTVTWTDHTVVAGMIHGYYMVGVYDTDTATDPSTANPQSTYDVSKNVDSITGTDFPAPLPQPVFVQQAFSRADSNGLLASSAVLSATDAQGNPSSDGTTFVKVCFNSSGFNPSAANVDAWYVFYSPNVSSANFDYSRPWQVIAYGDPAHDTTATDRCLYLGGNGNTPGGKSAFVARAYKKAAVAPTSGYPFVVDTSGQNDANTSLTAVVIPPLQSNYVYLPKTYTKLGYDMWMGVTEAIQNASGSLPASFAVNTDVGADAGQKLYNCNKAFHEQSNAFDSTNCGSGTLGTQTVKTGVNVANPIANVTWNQAWGLCRESSITSTPTAGAGQMLMRLPSSEEWRRAARVAIESYGSGLIEANTANCNIGSGTVAKTGSKGSCLTGVANSGNPTGTNLYTQLFDMGGNVAEWVDDRIVVDDVFGTTRDRFGYPNSTTRYVVGRTVHNGLDNLTRDYRLMNFGASNQVLGLALGPDYSTAGAYSKQADTETEQWLDVGSSANSVGFRCAAFFPGYFPSESQLQMPNEPQYASGDMSGVASTWTIPPTKYTKQNRLEKVRVTAGSTSTFGALNDGSINFAWSIYKKFDCVNSGTTCAAVALPTSTQYQVLRWEEPNYVDIRGTTPWALTGPNSSYSSVQSMDPLAIHSDGSLVYNAPPAGLLKLFTAKTCTNAGETANWGCSITDTQSVGTANDPSHLYRYMLLVIGPNGEFSFPRRQRFRSPYVAGTPSNVLNGLSDGAPSFRTEPGFRLAGVFPIDEKYESSFTGLSGTGNGDPQVMVHVPMDRSGLDRDFFVYRYEASLNSASAGGQAFAPPGTAGAYFPVINSGNWDSHAGQCIEQTLRTGSSTACQNGNPGTVQSKAHVRAGYYSGSNMPLITRADYYTACANTKLLGGDNVSGPRYHLHLTTQSEWFAASDWGNNDLQTNVISDPESPLYNGTTPLTIPQVEGNGATMTAGYCNTPATRAYGTAAPHLVGSSDDPNVVTGGLLSPAPANVSTQMQCASRYGAIDMVGNLREFTDVVYANGAGAATMLDNGVDGMGVNTSIKYLTTPYTNFDLLRGVLLANATGATSINFNSNQWANYYQETAPTAGGPYPLQFGGDWWSDDPNEEGRFSLRIGTTVDNDTTKNRPYSGGRCAYGW